MDCILESEENDSGFLSRVTSDKERFAPLASAIIWELKVEKQTVAPEATELCFMDENGSNAPPCNGRTLDFAVLPGVTARALARVSQGGLSPKCPNSGKSLTSLNHRSPCCVKCSANPTLPSLGATKGTKGEDRWSPRGWKF